MFQEGDIVKIERINSNQIKFTLTQDDLDERDIKLPELVFGSEKSQTLFKEIMTQAFNECDFDVENTPVMIEATPLLSQGIIIIVTKVTDDFDIEDGTNLMPDTRTSERYKTRDLDFATRTSSNKNSYIYLFDSLDLVSLASSNIVDKFEGESILFKNQSKYLLAVSVTPSENEEPASDTPTSTIPRRRRKRTIDNFSDNFGNIDVILSEYGLRQPSASLSEAHLKEHYEIIVKENAIKIMSNL